MERLKNLIKHLATIHLKLGHREYAPHFAYLNDEKDMLLPSQMRFPFVLFGHGGYQVLEGEEMRRWNVVLSVQTHVSDTGDECEKNCAMNMCGSILDDLLSRMTSAATKMENAWARGIDLAEAVGMPIENKDEALYGWVIEFTVSLPWCRKVNDVWEDLTNGVNPLGYEK